MTHSSTMPSRVPLFTELSRMAWRSLNRLLPKTRLGDRIDTWLWFVRIHRRLPEPSRMLFLDQLYRIKTTSAILDPLRVFTTDKEYLKDFVRAVVGDRYVIPTFAVLRSPAEVRSFTFPECCVIKPTHLSGPVMLRTNAQPLDFDAMCAWFAQDHYYWTREANYRHLAPKVIVERLVFDSTNVMDYKVFCWRGEPRLIQVDSDRHTEHRRGYFDASFKLLPFSMGYPELSQTLFPPDNLQEMLHVASVLSERFDLVRVDLYSNGREIRVGELTHVHGNIREAFLPRSGEVQASQILFGSALSD